MSPALGHAELALAFARPAAAWALIAPLLFLFLLRSAARPPEIVVGTLELWRGVRAARPAHGRVRPRVEAWALACALGLLLGALAWLGPRGARAEAARSWICVVDRSPSMGFAAASEGARTRLDAAMESALAWLARESGPADRVRWLAPGRRALELAPDERPERDWLTPDEHGRGEPEWELFDRPGTLWITDREPAASRRHAGLFASGGAAVPGAIAADGKTTWVWEGGELRELAGPRVLTVRVLEPSGGRLPEVLERVLAAWCAARGLELARADGAETLLVIELAPSGGSDEELLLERDGWRASGRGALSERIGSGEGEDSVAPADEEWLLGRTSSGATRPVVRAGPGRVRVGLHELSEPAGDPALFALSWARLLERWALPPAGVLGLAERQAAGAPRSAPGEPASPVDAADLGPTIDAALAFGALLCALLSCLLLPRERSEHAMGRQARGAAAGHQ